VSARQEPHTDASGTTDATPRVSVVIPTYDRPSYLRSAVESVREQTYDRIELIVVDDHSPTPARETLEDVERDAFDGFECVRHDENRGVNAARNTGIRTATGEYIAFLDDDDTWADDKLERQVAAFAAADDDVGLVYTGAEMVKQDSREPYIPPAVEEMTKALLCRNVVGTMSAVMVRADVASTVPLDERFPSWADLEWYVNLSRQCAFERVPEPLVVYEHTSHGRLSDDFEKTRRSYRLFLEEFEPLAASYGPVFRQKMRGWTAFRAGTSAFYAGHYAAARRFLATAVAAYPLEPSFHKYLVASLGGRSTHRAARLVKQFTP
jgi:glycosyltransferase involved in cell wall biosynthesis